jgi:Rho-type GTPase-activating protein 1/2
MREIDELTESRKAILEETAALHARIEELSGLSSQMERNNESNVFQPSYEHPPSPSPPPPPPSNTKLFTVSTSSNMSYSEENNRTLKGRPSEPTEHSRGGLFKRSKNKEASTPIRSDSSPPSATINGFPKSTKSNPHSFTQMALLRVARCDHCNDKMWGSQSRCQGGSFSS